MKILKVKTIENTEKKLVYFSKDLFLKLYKEQIPQQHHINGPVNVAEMTRLTAQL